MIQRTFVISLKPISTLYLFVCLQCLHGWRLGFEFGGPEIILPSYPDIFRVKFPNDLFRKKIHFSTQNSPPMCACLSVSLGISLFLPDGHSLTIGPTVDDEHR